MTDAEIRLLTVDQIRHALIDAEKQAQRHCETLIRFATVWAKRHPDEKPLLTESQIDLLKDCRAKSIRKQFELEHRYPQFATEGTTDRGEIARRQMARRRFIAANYPERLAEFDAGATSPPAGPSMQSAGHASDSPPSDCMAVDPNTPSAPAKAKQSRLERIKAMAKERRIPTTDHRPAAST